MSSSFTSHQALKHRKWQLFFLKTTGQYYCSFFWYYMDKLLVRDSYQTILPFFISYYGQVVGSLIHYFSLFTWLSVCYICVVVHISSRIWHPFLSIKPRKKLVKCEEKSRKYGDILFKVKEKTEKSGDSILECWSDIFTQEIYFLAFCLSFAFRAWKVPKAEKKLKKQIDTFADALEASNYGRLLVAHSSVGHPRKSGSSDMYICL